MQSVLKVMDVMLKALGIAVLCVMVAVMGAQVFCRYVLLWPLGWPEEASLFTFCWCTYVGICLVARKNGHLRLDLLPTLFPRLASVLDRVAMLVSAAYFAFCAWLGAIMTMQIKMMGFSAVGFPLPQWIVWLIIPACSAMAAIITLYNFFMSFKVKSGVAS